MKGRWQWHLNGKTTGNRASASIVFPYRSWNYREFFSGGHFFTLRATVGTMLACNGWHNVGLQQQYSGDMYRILFLVSPTWFSIFHDYFRCLLGNAPGTRPREHPRNERRSFRGMIMGQDEWSRVRDLINRRDEDFWVSLYW